MKKIALASLILFPIFLSAQRFGGTPPSVKWKQINTDSVRVIFPAGLDSQAQRVASLVHYQAAYPAGSTGPLALGKSIHKVSIVLQNLPTIANAYVGLGPFRSEFYLTPGTNSFDLGSTAWQDELAIHEYRHVQQFNNFHNGLSQVLYVLAGEDGLSLAINASIPDWFYEGDAVYNETILSKQGRGRLPFFMNAYPSLWQSGKNYSWMKLRNGSLKDYVPNHYNLGYLLVNYGREKYGVDFWSKVTHDASAFKGLFYPFQKAIEHYAGVDYKTFREQAFAWYRQADAAKPVKATADSAIFPLNTKVVTNYLFPYSVSDHELLYLKSAYNKRPTFYLKDNEGVHFLRVKDISIDDQFSYRNGKIVYAAYENDARWHWQEYSVIKLLDLNGNKKTLTHKTRYFSPDISQSGDRIAAVYMGTDGKSELHILDAASGKITDTVKAISDGSVYTDPKFISEDSIVYGVRQSDGTMMLAVVDLHSGITKRLTPPSYNVVGFPCSNNGTIYFTASYGGNDDIFAIKPGNTTVYRVTQGSLGNYYVNVGNGKITWSALTADGYQLRQMDENAITFTPMPETAIDNTVLAFPVSHEKDITPILPDMVPSRKFPVSKYRKSTRLFNFHSWRPYYEDPEYTFSIYGENVLNTMQTELYYLYNRDDRTSAVGANATYGGLFPYLSIGTQYTFDRKASAGNKLKQWDQSDSRIGLSFPFSWTKNLTNDQLQFGSNYYFRHDFNKGFYKDSFTTIQFSYLQHFISWSQQVEVMPQHIFPRLGYDVSAEFRHAITNYKSWQFLGRGSVYFPGFLPSHSLVFTGAWQETDTANALFGSRFPYSRGYNAAYFTRMWKVGANYHFPLFYPDWGFGNILYFKRVRANAFFDMTKVFSTDKTASANQRSVGGELYFDTRWWNQYDLTFGLRMSYLLDRDFYTNQSRVAIFEIVLPVSIEYAKKDRTPSSLREITTQPNSPQSP